MHTLAHEIGHVFFGPGHPDQVSGPGVAPLDGVRSSDKNVRLMRTGLGIGAGSNDRRVCVKAEWDKAERWLSEHE